MRPQKKEQGLKKCALIWRIRKTRRRRGEKGKPGVAYVPHCLIVIQATWYNIGHSGNPQWPKLKWHSCHVYSRHVIQATLNDCSTEVIQATLNDLCWATRIAMFLCLLCHPGNPQWLTQHWSFRQPSMTMLDARSWMAWAKLLVEPLNCNCSSWEFTFANAKKT